MSNKVENSGMKIAQNTLWAFFERFGSQIVSFIVSIVLARFILPDDYGVIAIVTLFIGIANVFVTGGFSNALIQKKEVDHVDFSSVLYFGMGFSICLYLLLFFVAPYISLYFRIEELTTLLRIMGIQLIISSFNSVQRAYVSRNLMFRRFFFSTLGGISVSGAVGIVMAFLGYGVWSLMVQYILNTLIDTIVLFFTIKWRPTLAFSFKRLKILLSYGWKLLFATLLTTIYSDLYTWIIARKYNSADLAYYKKGKSFPQLLAGQVGASLDSVLFSSMSRESDNKAKLKYRLRQSIRFGSFIILPLIVGLAIVAKPFINFILTDVWADAVIYLQIACISFLVSPIGSMHIQVVKALGKSGIYLILDILKKLVGVIVLIVFINKGVIAIALAEAFANFVGLFINIIPNIIILRYNLLEQLKDLTSALLLTLIMSLSIYWMIFLPIPSLLCMFLQIIVAGVVYIGVSFLFKVKALQESIKIIKAIFGKKGNVKNEG
ncbi:MAG: lipopolysaccharide biosynthesis protein [Clostridia bacterium]|nr:lipopolysaccharide biosynthesis protein [Clostridia bacterium]